MTKPPLADFPIFETTVFAQNPEFATMVGFIIEAWTYIDRCLREFLVYCLGCSPEQAGAILESQSSMNGRIDTVQAVVHLMPDHRHKDDLLRVLGDIRHRAKTRNKIVHGQYLESDS